MDRIEKFDPKPTCQKCGMAFQLEIWGPKTRHIYPQGLITPEEPPVPCNHVSYMPAHGGSPSEGEIPSRLCIFCPVCGFNWFMHPADRTAADIERLYTEGYLGEVEGADKPAQAD